MRSCATAKCLDGRVRQHPPRRLRRNGEIVPLCQTGVVHTQHDPDLQPDHERQGRQSRETIEDGADFDMENKQRFTKALQRLTAAANTKEMLF